MSVTALNRKSGTFHFQAGSATPLLPQQEEGLFLAQQQMQSEENASA